LEVKAAKAEIETESKLQFIELQKNFTFILHADTYVESFYV